MESTQRERITEHIENNYGSAAEHLWAQYPDYSVFRHPGSKKWFGIIMNIPGRKLGLPGDGYVDVLDIKCSGVMIGSLLLQKGYYPAYHMSKSSWISILLDGTVPDGEILSLLDLSYDAVAPRRRKAPEAE